MFGEGSDLRKTIGNDTVRRAIVVSFLLRLFDVLQPQHKDPARLRDVCAPVDQYRVCKFVEKHFDCAMEAVISSEECGGCDPITRPTRICSTIRHITEKVMYNVFEWG